MKTHKAPGAYTSSVRVMLVDDSAVIRGIMRRWIDAENGLVVVGSAINGQEAISEAARVQPDIIVLDLEMPVLSGMDALPQLKTVAPDTKILIASTLTTRNARASLAAMRAGATDYLEKPDSATTRDHFREQLVIKLRALGEANSAQTDQITNLVSIEMKRRWKGEMSALAIGASTGGPQALTELFGSLSGGFKDCSVFVTQHMPSHFTKLLGEDLSERIGLPGGEAIDGEKVSAGRLYVAPGGHHMGVVDDHGILRIDLCDGPAINFCKPAVDPMLESLAKQFGTDCVAVMLTGMGCDGAIGSKEISDGGGLVLAQDQETSVVWGMPGAAVAAGVVDQVLPLHKIGERLKQLKR